MTITIAHGSSMAFTHQVKILSRLLAYLLKRKQHLKRELGQKIKQLMQQLKLKNYIQQVVA